MKEKEGGKGGNLRMERKKEERESGGRKLRERNRKGNEGRV